MKAVINLFKLVALGLRYPRNVGWFLSTYLQRQRTAAPEWRANLAEIKLRLHDRHDAAGSVRGHYFLQDVWAAQWVHRHAAAVHVDVGSRVDGFVAHVVSFKPVQYVDIRPLPTQVPGLTWVCGSVCALPFADQSVASLSCLHVIEHVGLARYGDPLDPNGWLTGLRELQRVLQPGGQLTISTPCGRPRVVFHAHRVFAPAQIVGALPELKLLEFSLIKNDTATAWIPNAPLSAADGLAYGCGLFRFTR
jgi:SAM-dependent methyltransferase